MENFLKLLEVVDQLHGEKGCPWAREQTFETLQKHLVEEMYEVLDALASKEDRQIADELGDLLYVLLSYTNLGEKEGRFSLEEIAKNMTDKVVRRSPHIFGDKKASTAQEALDCWNAVKKEEQKGKTVDPMIKIPKSLPLMERAERIFKLYRKKGEALFTSSETLTEARAREQLLKLIAQSERDQIDLTRLLREELVLLERKF